YPTPDKIPPMDPAFLKGLDLTRVPRIPVRKAPEGGGSPTCPPGGAGPGECWWTCDKCLGPQDISACPENNQWGLTYDDGPSPNSTMLLDHMQSHRIQATVFVVGSRVIEYPAILRREYAQGHDIAMHGWSHTAWTSLTNEQLVAELQWTARAIKEVIGVTPTYVRPPYGDIDNRIRGVLDALGYRAVIWSHDTNDWYLNYGNPTNYNPAWVSGNITQWISKAPTATEGIIALEHDLSGEGVRLAIGAIDQMVKAGMKPQSVSQCLG
ncbi:MAG: family 4 carbohydrate esterase, partial [Piptocephalis tieghemiana]